MDKEYWQQQIDILQAIADHSGAVIGAKDLAGHYLYVNQQYSRLFNRSVQDFIGKTDAELFPAATAEQFRRADQLALKSNVAISVEEQVDINGVSVDFLSQKFPIRDQQGQVFATGLVATDISKLKQLQRQLQNLADHDALTQCYNRRRILEISETHLKKARRYQQDFSVLLFDLDHFKRINDVYGHAVGDQVLIGFVERVKAELRNPDDFGRVGGEEFIALLPDTNARSALALSERIRLTIADWECPPLRGDRVTVSIGIAEFSLQLQRMDEIVAAADHALYQAKAHGRNCVRLY